LEAILDVDAGRSEAGIAWLNYKSVTIDRKFGGMLIQMNAPQTIEMIPRYGYAAVRPDSHRQNIGFAVERDWPGNSRVWHVRF
jgi:hypothetical protein